MEQFEKNFIGTSSIPLVGGGDTHIHPFGPKESDFVVTTRIPLEPVLIGDGNFSLEIHDLFNPLHGEVAN